MPNKIITLTRLFYRDDGVFSVVDDDGVPFCLAVEPPWKNNIPMLSCIPPGPGHSAEYELVRIESPKFGETFEVVGNHGRLKILIHWGNHVVDLPDDKRDSDGCILLGEQLIPYKSITGIGMSKHAFSEFMSRLEGQNRAKLIIQNVEKIKC